MTDDEVKLEFKKVKRKFTLINSITLLLFFGGIAMEILTDYEGVGFNMGLVAFVVFTVGVLTVYKCPRCGEPPYSSEPEGGVVLSPKKCKKCGADFE